MKVSSGITSTVIVSAGRSRSTRVRARSSTKAPSSRFSSTEVIGYDLNARRAAMRNDSNSRPSIRRAITAFIASGVEGTR